MNHARDATIVEFEMLRRLGGKWAVLTAMSLALHRKGANLPPDIGEKLKMARVKIGSGCFSPCEANCALSEVESLLFNHAPQFDDEEFMLWSDLLGAAAQGHLDYARICTIPALEPVHQDCRFLGCSCGKTE